MKNKKYSLSLCLLGLLLVAGCSAGSTSSDEVQNDTSPTTVSASEEDTTASEAEDATAAKEIAKETTTEATDEVTADNEADANDVIDTAPTIASHENNPYWNSKYAYLQALLEENSCMGGVMYVELVNSSWNEDYIRECLEYDRISDYLPVYENGAVVLGEGEQLFALLPAEDAWITIYPSEMNENAEYVDDLSAPLYEGKVGEPILLRCNYGDWHSNVYVTVQNSEAMYEMHPTMSGQYAYVMTPANGWYDIAPLDIRSFNYEALEWFQHNYGYEIEDGLANGYSLEFMSPEYHFNHYVLKLGMYHSMDDESEEIDTYAEYAVDFTYTYKMNPDTGFYEVIGDGMHFDSIEDAEMYLESLNTFENADGAVG